ncbi:response regulator transcription factor [Methylocystis bryophila]|uniref:Two-component system response regulator n=1 Tax=Methylocystis bryophila TaxID=655015 RepID=A0A1W6MXY7_9HYPH|nr:response regulator transcription factor [Methylocystis bryophila]ARN82447.1 two-component system response regulator [Methylocystis bryophila]BDV38632.1 DNA-binding response regulator [Methylocystis bryophila]
MRILILEDNDDLALRLVEQIADNGFEVDRVATIREAGEKIAAITYSLAILDRRLPDGDGIRLAPQIRSLQPNARIMMLTALDDEDQKIAGLDAGADDYLTKPYNPKELMARIRANLRRADGAVTPITRVANLCFAPDSREVTVGGKAIVLQRRELALLEALMRRPGRVVQRDRIFEDLYGDHEDLHWNHLNGVVSHLRKSLKDAGARVEIHVARGIGYFIATCD